MTQPRNHQTPARRVIRASSLKLPGASASGAFSAGVKECLTAEFESSPGDNTTLPCRRAVIAGGGIRVLILTDGIRATCQPGDETPRHIESQAKEPFAIPYQAHSMAGDTGGSSRLRPQSGLRVLSCRSRSAAEAQGFDLGCSACAPTAGRSGWKPRALLLSGGAETEQNHHFCDADQWHKVVLKAGFYGFQTSGISGWFPLSGGLTSWRGRAHGTRTLSGRGHWSAHPSADRGRA